MLRRLANLFARLQRPKRASSLRLSIMDDGVTLFADNQQAWTFQWQEVTRIGTYKRDLLTAGMICLDFTVAARHLTFSTDDEMQDFDLLCRQLLRIFPTIAPDWWSQVAFPAFATQHAILYTALAV